MQYRCSSYFFTPGQSSFTQGIKGGRRPKYALENCGGNGSFNLRYPPHLVLNFTNGTGSTRVVDIAAVAQGVANSLDTKLYKKYTDKIGEHYVNKVVEIDEYNKIGGLENELRSVIRYNMKDNKKKDQSKSK